MELSYPPRIESTYKRNVIVAQSVLIIDHNHFYEDIGIPVMDQGLNEGGRIRIGEGSWIGHGAAIVCPRGELTIGRNSVVAANAVVTRSVPPYSVVFGSPATIIKQYDPETRAWHLGPKTSRAKRNGVSTTQAGPRKLDAELFEKS